MSPAEKKEVADQLLAVLQSAFEADPAAVHALMCNRVPCNAKLVEHPHVIVDASPVLVDAPTVGTLGFLNGLLLAIDADQVIGLVFGDAADGEHKVFQGFCLTERQR